MRKQRCIKMWSNDYQGYESDARETCSEHPIYHHTHILYIYKYIMYIYIYNISNIYIFCILYIILYNNNPTWQPWHTRILKHSNVKISHSIVFFFLFWMLMNFICRCPRNTWRVPGFSAPPPRPVCSWSSWSSSGSFGCAARPERWEMVVTMAALENSVEDMEDGQRTCRFSYRKWTFMIY